MGAFFYSMISVNNIYQSFGNKVLFDHSSLFIAQKDKLGLVGRNGAGKSTLLKMLAGFNKPMEGDISKSSTLTIGYLAQSLDIASDRSVRDACREVFGDMRESEARKTELEAFISDPENLGLVIQSGQVIVER